MIINHVFLQRASAFLLDVLQYLSSYIGLFQIDSLKDLKAISCKEKAVVERINNQ